MPTSIELFSLRMLPNRIPTIMDMDMEPIGIKVDKNCAQNPINTQSEILNLYDL